MLQFIRNLSISNKLGFLVTATAFISLFVAIVTVGYLDVQKYTADQLAVLRNQAILARDLAATSLSFDISIKTEELVEPFKANPSIVEAAILDTDYKVVRFQEVDPLAVELRGGEVESALYQRDPSEKFVVPENTFNKTLRSRGHGPDFERETETVPD